MTDDAAPPARRPLGAAARMLFRDAFRAYWTLVKVMVPVLIVVHMLQNVGIVEWLGRMLGPVMELVGLPGSMGLVWATAMLINIYTGIAVYASLAPHEPLTVAQVTVLACMMLVAHGLPLELRIAQKAGARVRVMLPLRVLGAFALGLLLHHLYARTGLLQGPSSMLLKQRAQSDWLVWLVELLGKIFVIILALMFLLRVLRRIGVTQLMARMLQPVLRALGMGPEAAPVTIIGITLGITFGGGLIIDEARSGRISRRDVFFSVALMSLCHSLFEDTFLMLTIGAHLSGILLGRMLFALVVVFLLVRLAGGKAVSSEQ